MSNQTVSQTQFLNSGGIYAMPLARAREQGLMTEEYVYKEYPKMLRISRGVHEVKSSTQNIQGQTIEWTEEKELFDEIVVDSEEEEERVLAGGKTAAQIEEERVALMVQADQRGIKIDPSWGILRIQRELGAPAPAPADDLAALERRIALLEREAELLGRIKALGGNEPADETEDLRRQLRGLGVTPDGRWSVERLRREIDTATAPKG